MSRTLKIILGVVVGLVVVVGIALFTLFSQLEDIIRAAVEQVGSDVTGTEVRLGDVDISLQEGKGSLSGFRLTNPDGFNRDDAFRFDKVSLTLDVDSVFPVLQDPVIIKEIIIDRPQITYELNKRGNNLDAIKGNVDKNTAGDGSASKDEGDSDTPNFVIQNLYFRNGTVSVAASDYFDDKLTADLPAIHLQNIGSQGQGATPEQIVEETFEGLYGGIEKAISSINLDALVENAEKALDEAGKAAGDAAREAEKAADDAAREAGKAADDAMKGAGDMADDAGKAVGGAADDAEKAIKGLFD